MLKDVSMQPNPVIEAYKKDVDRSLLKENLKLTPEQRIDKAQQILDFVLKVRQAGNTARAQKGQ